MTDALRSLQIGQEQRSRLPMRTARRDPRRRWILLSVAAAGAAGIATWFAVTSTGTPVQVTTVVSAEASERGEVLTASGYVRHARVVNVVPRVSGVIATLAVAEGDVVREGDLIATLDREELEQQVAESRAGLRATQAELAALEAGARREEI